MTNYEIAIATGNVNYAGTDANVDITLYGTKGNGSRTFLDDPRRDDFEKGNRDRFVIRQDDLGEIKGLAVQHDNSSDGAGWFLDRITVKNLTTNNARTFTCNRWLAADEDDGCTYRLLGEIPNSVNLRSTRESRLTVGRWMYTDARLSRSSHRLNARTHVWARNEFTGFTGGVIVAYIDETGAVIGTSNTHDWGVDGTWNPTGPSSRDTPWTEQVDPDVALRTRSLAIWHFHNPRGMWRTINRHLDEIIAAGKKAAGAYQYISSKT